MNMKQALLLLPVFGVFIVSAQPQMDIGVDAPQRKQIANKLNVVLADEYVLFTKLFNYHWNVTGMSFGPLHNLFEKQYETLFTIIDNVAERIRSLDSRPIGTLKEFLSYTNIEEEPGKYPEAQAMVSQLIVDYQTVVRHMRQELQAIDEIGDPVTSNFLQDIIQKHEKAIWMFRAHLV